MSEENKSLVRRYYKEATGDLSGIEEIVAPGFVDHHFPPDMPEGPAGVRKFFTEFAGGIFSDMRIEIDFLLAEGDKVDCHFVFHARHTGAMGDILPRGNPIRLPAISTFRIAGGKLAEAWEIFDSGTLLTANAARVNSRLWQTMSRGCSERQQAPQPQPGHHDCAGTDSQRLRLGAGNEELAHGGLFNA